MFNLLRWYRKKAVERAIIKETQAREAKNKAIAKFQALCEHDWIRHEYKRTCKKCGRYEVFMYRKFGDVRYYWEGINPIDLELP